MTDYRAIGEQIVAEAYAAFDTWCREHDPEGEWSLDERLKLYGKWCDAGNKVQIVSQDREAAK